jgi:hypothetical protein
MKITIKMEASETSTSINVDLEDLGVSEELWDKMDDSMKEDLAKEYVDNLHTQPFWVVENVTED